MIDLDLIKPGYQAPNLSEEEIRDRMLAAELYASAPRENLQVLARTGWNGLAQGHEGLAQVRTKLTRYRYTAKEIDLLVREVGLAMWQRTKEAKGDETN